MKFYLSKNKFGSESCFGFSNTWVVLCFDSKLNRRNYLNKYGEDDISVREINRNEVTSYIDGTPRKNFGEAYVIYYDKSHTGLIGFVDIGYANHISSNFERFHKIK